jgi:hypothetical protein
MHPDQRAGVHERLDDGRQRAVPVVVVVGDGTTWEIEVDPEFPLILRYVRSRRRIDARLCLCGSGESLDSVGFDRQN